MKKPLLTLCLFTSLLSLTNAQDRLSGKTFATRAVVMARHGMACTSHPLSTQAAIDVLRSGGNAIDAAIAANAMEGLVEPHVNGMGAIYSPLCGMPKTKSITVLPIPVKTGRRLGFETGR